MSTSSSRRPHARRRSLLIWTGVFSAFIAGSFACGSSSDGDGVAPSLEPTTADDADTDGQSTTPSKKDASTDPLDAWTPPDDDDASPNDAGADTDANAATDAGTATDAGPPPTPGTKHTALAISSGIDHTCALLDDHSIKCWGKNLYGQLGIGDSTDERGDKPNQMGDNLPAVDLGKGRSALAIAAGNGHTCTILDNHSVKCWGWNGSGQLGLGDITSRGGSPSQMGDKLPAVDLGKGRSALAIAVGNGHTCAIL